jgi:hypothetical protein
MHRAVFFGLTLKKKKKKKNQQNATTLLDCILRCLNPALRLVQLPQRIPLATNVAHPVKSMPYKKKPKTT